ncbi:hypothetical protein ACRAWG_25645 [Methylobacterium sp. P31]
MADVAVEPITSKDRSDSSRLPRDRAIKLSDAPDSVERSKRLSREFRARSTQRARSGVKGETTGLTGLAGGRKKILQQNS